MSWEEIEKNQKFDVGVLITFIYLFLFYFIFFVAYIIGNNKT